MEEKNEQNELALQFRTLYQHHILVEFDMSGKILNASPAFLKLMSYSLSDLMSKNYRLFVPQEQKFLPEVMEFWNNLKEKEYEQGEFLRVTKNNEKVWLLETYHVLRNSEGTPYKIIELALNISDKKQIEQQNIEQLDILKLQENILKRTINRVKEVQKHAEITEINLQHIVDNTPIVIFSLNQKGIYTTMRGKGLEGIAMKEDDFVGKSVYDLPNFREDMLEKFSQAFKGEKIFTVDNYENGTSYEYCLIPHFNFNKEQIGVIGFAIDISSHTKAEQEIIRKNKELEETLKKLKNTQMQLVQSEKMSSLGQLTAGIAHEINNPMNFVYAGSQALQSSIIDLTEVIDAYEALDQIENMEDFKDKIQKIKALKKMLDFDMVKDDIKVLSKDIHEGAVRTVEIVKNLRTFSRLDEDVLKSVDLHENIDSTLVILRSQYTDRIEIIKDYAELPRIECIAGQMNQVFMNILSNAIEHMIGKGTIRIKTSLNEESMLVIAIKDTGKGMTEEVKQHIFEPFFTTKAVGKGTGLGLSISHSIVEKHKGKIWVETEIDKGTEVFVVLPVFQDDF
ncbi:MAG: PAS domain S-box protein [Bacteroidetes bacterium]|nr:MAG: PAS domain S-box protein [Bacteroidota bacterium]